VRLWDNATGGELNVLREHTKKVRSVAFSPRDGNSLASGSEDGLVYLWDVPTGRVKRKLPVNNLVNAVAFSLDGKFLATESGDRYQGKSGKVTLWDPDEGTVRASLEVPEGAVTALAFSRDGWVAFWSARYVTHDSIPGGLTLWDPATGEERILQRHVGGVSSIAFSRDGQTVASGGGDETVKLWDVRTTRERAILTGHTDRVMAVAFSSDDKTLVTGSIDRTVRRWHTASDADVCRFYERLMSLYSNNNLFRKNLVLSCWGCHLHCDRERAEERAEANKWLQKGLEDLRIFPDNDRLITEEQKKKWIEEFERVLREAK
jgi:WD40 repeat protein